MPSHEAPGADNEPTTIEDVLIYARQVEAYINNHFEDMTLEAINGIHQTLQEIAHKVYAHRDATVQGSYRIYKRDGNGNENFYLEDGLISGIAYGFIIEPANFFQDGEAIGALSPEEIEISDKIMDTAKGNLVVSHVILYTENDNATEPLGAFEETKQFAVAPIGTSTMNIFEVSDEEVEDGLLSESERLLQLIDEPARAAIASIGYELLYSENALLSMQAHLDTLEPIMRQASDRDLEIITRYLYESGLDFFSKPVLISPEQPLIIDDEAFGEDLVQLSGLPAGTTVNMEGLYVYSRYTSDNEGREILDVSDSSLYAHASLLKNSEGDKLHILIPISHYRNAAAELESNAASPQPEL